MDPTLSAAVEAGEVDTVLSLLAALEPRARRAVAAELQALAASLLDGDWGSDDDGSSFRWRFHRGSDDARRAAAAAVWVTATAAELAKSDVRPPQREPAALVDAVRRVPPPWVDQAGVDALADGGWLGVELAEHLVSAGVAPRPRSDGFIESLVGTGFRSELALADRLRQLPSLLEGPIYRVFEVEGGTQTSLAAADKYRHESNQWATALYDLAESGELDRQRLLDGCLDALARDFAPFRAGWFTRFHDKLAPSLDERAARADGYLRLIGSAVPATVSFAVKAVELLVKKGRAGADDVLGHLAPALSARQKGTVTRALKLLQRLAKGDPTRAAAAADVAVAGLLHEDAAVQAKVLDTIEALVADLDAAARARIRDALADHRDLVAPSLRDRIPADDPGDDAVDEPRTFAPVELPSLRDPARALPAVDGVAATVELTSRTLEVPEAEGFERALGAIAALAGADVGELGGPLAKRARDLLGRRDAGEHTLRSALARIAIAWITGEAGSEPLPAWAARGPYRFLSARLDQLARRLADGVALPLLSTPTHRGGAVATATFHERLATWAAADRAIDGYDATLALMRLAPPDRAEARRALPRVSAATALALDEAAEVVARRYTPEVDPRHSGPYTFYDVDCAVVPALEAPETALELRRMLAAGGSMRPAADGALRGWLATVEPDALELYFRDGLFAMGWAMDEDASGGHLRPALDPAVTLGVTGHWLLALCLGARGARAVELALDVAIDGLASGRVAEDELGAALSAILTSGLGKGARYAASLGQVAQASQAHAASVARVVARALRGDPDAAPRDIGKLLLLLNEVLISSGEPLADPEARAWLTAMKRGGQVAKAKKALLAHPTG